MKKLRFKQSSAHIVFLALLFLANVAAGQTTYVLQLPGSGTAMVTISKNTHTAYITDGGKQRVGIASAQIEGEKDILIILQNEGVEEVYITCTHPHADHQDGLIELVKDPAILGFKKVHFVATASDRPLSTTFLATHGDRAKEIIGDILDPTDRDVFAGRIPANANVRVENFKYAPTENAGPHGRCVILIYTLSDGGKTTRVVDMDDAETALVKRFSAAVEADPARFKPDVLLAPHHGANTTDIRLMLREKVRPRYIVVSAPPFSQYSHPGDRFLTDATDALGADHVYITGGGGNVKITEAGLEPLAAKFVRENGRTIVAPLIAQLDRRLEALAVKESEDGSLSGSDKEKYSRLVDARESYRDLLNNQFDVPADSLPVSISKTSTDRKVVGPSNRTNPPPNAPQPLGSGPSSRPMSITRIKSSHTGDFNKLTQRFEQRMPSQPTPPRAARQSVRVARMSAALRGAPIFGGIVLGNIPVNAPHVRSARIVTDSGKLWLEIDIVGQKVPCRYGEFSTTELWAAYQLASPGSDASAIECNICGMSANYLFEWHFGINPAVSDTLIAQDAMKVDMLLAALSADDEAALVKKLPHIPKGWTTYQWYDAPSRITISGTKLSVEANDTPSKPLMRLRLWGEAAADGPQAVPQGILQRALVYDKVLSYASKNGIRNTDWCRVLQAESTFLHEIVEEVKDGTITSTDDIDDLDKRFERLIVKAGLAESPALKVKRIMEEAKLSDDPVSAFARMARQLKIDASEEFRVNATLLGTAEPLTDAITNVGDFDTRIKAAGLADTASYKLIKAELNAIREVEEGVPVAFDAADFLVALDRSYVPFNRFDRFARVAAVVHWLADLEKLPPLPSGVQPLTMSVPPRMRLGSVLNSPSQQESISEP